MRGENDRFSCRAAFALWPTPHSSFRNSLSARNLPVPRSPMQSHSRMSAIASNFPQPNDRLCRRRSRAIGNDTIHVLAALTSRCCRPQARPPTSCSVMVAHFVFRSIADSPVSAILVNARLGIAKLATGFHPPPLPILGAAVPDQIVGAILLFQQRSIERPGEGGIVEPDGEVFPARGFGCFLPRCAQLCLMRSSA